MSVSFPHGRITALSRLSEEGLRSINKITSLHTLFLDLNPDLSDDCVGLSTSGLPQLSSLTLFGCREITDRCGISMYLSSRAGIFARSLVFVFVGS